MSNSMRCVGAALMFLMGAVIPAGATEYYVSPSASSGGNGSRSNPWLLKAALQSSTVQPGDTVTLDAGTYVNPTNGQDAAAWVCTLQGTSSKPIIVRATRGARAILDGADTKQNGILRVSSSYVWYWGLEIISSDPGRVDGAPQTDANNLGSYPSVDYIKRGTGIDMSSGGSPTGNKFINCSIHDCFIGFGSTNTNDNTQLYGCLLYNNGWFNSGGGGRSHHGHNIYIHNATGEIKQFIDCITWGAFENNIQAWSGSDISNSEINDFYFDGLVSFLYGPQADGSSLLLGNVSPTNPTVTNSMFYQPGGASPTIAFGYNQGSGTIAGGNVSNNYIDAGEIYFNAAFSGTTFANNFITSGYVRGSVPSGSGNTVTGSKPTTNKVFVRPSRYEQGRANVVVYNWQGGSSVPVDMSSVFKTGDTYTIVDAQNPSAVLLSGSYAGPVSIPMTGTTAAQPVGNAPEGRTHTPSEFGTFIVTGGSGVVAVTTPPAATTGAASNITTTGAQLNGSVNPNGFSTTYHFEYGTTSSYGSSTSSANAGAGTGSSAVSAVLSGLTPATLYHYRIVASNTGGTTNGSDGTLTTAAAAGIPPAVSVSAATAITPNGAQLNGSVNPSGLSTTYHFDYGVTSSYGSSTTSASAGAGTGSSAVSAVLNGLTPATLYHYRIVASNNGGTTNSGDRTVTTAAGPPAPAVPVVTTLAATNVSATGATLAGTVNPNGVSAAYHFEYGPTNVYGFQTSSNDAGTGSSAVNVSAVLAGLTPGTLYHYRLVATNPGARVNGVDMTFTGLSITLHPGLTRDPHSLAQNYPNPFNPSTEIQYDLAVASDVSMKIYNSLGAEVATLVSEFQDAGTHLVRWGGQGFVSGIYFCVLKSGGMTSTRRMILVK